jgi:hypothetical protein
VGETWQAQLFIGTDAFLTMSEEREMNQMDEQKLEALIRRVVRDEVERSLYSPPSFVLQRAADEFAANVSERLECLASERIAEACVGTTAEAIGTAAVKEMVKFCQEDLLPAIDRVVQKAIHPYFVYVDRLIRRGEEESEWWKHGASQMEIEPQHSEQPLPPIVGPDAETIRSIIRQEVHDATQTILVGLSDEIYQQMELATEEVLLRVERQLDQLPLKTRERRNTSDSADNEGIPF